MHRAALEDGHHDLGDTVRGDNGSDDAAGNHEVTARIKDAVVEEESGEFDQGSRDGVKDLNDDETL